MRIGLFLGAAGAALPDLVAQARQAAEAGLTSVFFGQMTAWDAVMAAALVAREVPGVEVGTAVTTTFPRHPRVLAGQALTAQAISGGRFVLGVGPGHRQHTEELFGLAYERPARHTREYLTALRPLLAGEETPGATPPPVLVGALGPAMLRVAGELADGVVTTWAGAAAVAGHIVPGVTAAAEAAGRPAPRVAAGVVAALTSDPDGVREELARTLGFARDFPAYRAMLERQGLAGVHETVAAGDERALERQVRAYADAGATDLLVSPLGEAGQRARTVEFLGDLVRAGRAVPA